MGCGLASGVHVLVGDWKLVTLGANCTRKPGFAAGHWQILKPAFVDQLPHRGAEAASSNGASALTVTLSACEPTSSATGMVSASPTRTSIGPRSYFLKPCSSTVMRYEPGIRFSMS